MGKHIEMKHFFCSVILIISVSVLPMSAQKIKYPDEVKALYEKTDSQVTPDGGAAPLIAVPQTKGCESLVAAVQAAGLAAVIIPPTGDGAALRAMAASWDGAVMPEEWVREDDVFSVLFYKAVSDRNIPHIGNSSLSSGIDAGLMHKPGDIASIDALAVKAETFRHAKRLMDRILSLDAHADLPNKYRRGYELGARKNNQVSLQKMEEGHLSSQILISYLPQKELDAESSRKAFEKCDKTIDVILSDIEKNKEWCGLARCREDAVRLKAGGRKAFFLGIENGYGIGNDLRNVRYFADKGVIYITLSHLYDNAICHSSTHSADTTLGLTPFGKKVVREMNRHGIMVDVSHTSSGTFWDCIKYSKAPIICSHSGAASVYRHDRNITDDQLRAISAKNGLVMVYVVQQYMGKMGEVGIDDMMAHLKHCIDVAGIDHVGISCDLDGGGGGWDANSDGDVINITVRLLEEGYSDSDIEKIWSGNFFRVLDEVQRIAGR